MTSPVTGTFTSASADECAVFSFVLEGPVSAQAVVLAEIPSRFQLGTITPARLGPPQTVTITPIVMPIQLTRIRPTRAPAPLTVVLREIPPVRGGI
jgi:hypothetical protein